MTALAKVVDASVADCGAANDGVGAVEHEPVISHDHSTYAVGASLDVSEVTMMPGGHAGAAVNHAFGVEVRARSLAALDQVAYYHCKKLG